MDEHTAGVDDEPVPAAGSTRSIRLSRQRLEQYQELAVVLVSVSLVATLLIAMRIPDFLTPDQRIAAPIVLSTLAVSGFVVLDWAGKRVRELNALELQAHSDRLYARKDDAVDGADRARVAAELASVRAVQSVQPFEAELKRTRRAVWINQLAGGFTIVVVIGTGLTEWLGNSTPDGLTTGDGIARLGVITAAFFLASQLFGRANNLSREATELQRAVVAIQHIGDLADQITNDATREALIATVLAAHLTGPSAAAASDNADSTAITQLLALARK